MTTPNPGAAIASIIDALLRWAEEDRDEHEIAHAELVTSLGVASAAALRWRAECGPLDERGFE